MKLKLPKKKLFQAALKNNNWPVNWFDPKKDIKSQPGNRPYTQEPGKPPKII